MEVLYILIGASFLLGFLGLLAFIWATKSGQFEDLQTPAEKIVFDD